MTRKDYVMLAEVFAKQKSNAPPSQYVHGWDDARRVLAEELAATLAADNPRFDRARFLKAAGVTP